MKTLLFIVLIFISQAAWTENLKNKEQNKNTITFILLGQSNMAGQGNLSEISKAKKTLPKNVNFYLNGSISQISKQKKFGPEVSFAHAVSSAYPNKSINIIKFAPGGSLMKDWQKNGHHYRTLKKQLARISKKTNLNASAILWMQGERDCKSPQLAKAYSANLRNFINTIRKDLKKPKLPVIIGRVSVPEAFRPAVKEIRKAQELVSKKVPYVALLSTDSLKKNADRIHFSSQGQLKLGRLFATTFLR